VRLTARLVEAFIESCGLDRGGCDTNLLGCFGGSVKVAFGGESEGKQHGAVGQSCCLAVAALVKPVISGMNAIQTEGFYGTSSSVTSRIPSGPTR
jgi:hypothetical protein